MEKRVWEETLQLNEKFANMSSPIILLLERGATILVIHESAEDYLESILIFQERRGQVRSIDIVNELGYSKPSVSIAMKKLRENGYIAVDGEGNLTLLEPGLEIAQRIYSRHQLLTHFFVQLGVDEQTAAEDACKAEHILSEQTLEKIRESALRNDAAHPQAK